MVKIIDTSRTYLRLFENDDLADLCALHQDPEVMRFIGSGVRESREAVKQDLDGYISHQETHGYGRWAIIDRTNCAFVGRAGFLYLSDTDEIDLGYTLHRCFWGQGLATEVGTALVNWARVNLPIEKVIGIVTHENTASIRVLEKIGMSFTENSSYFGFDVRKYGIR